MKKSMIAMVCVALLVLNALVVFAMAPAIEPGSMAPKPASVARPTTLRPAPGCSLEITTNRADTYFVGKARRECVEKNKFNLNCQKQCFDEVKLLARQTTFNRAVGTFARIGCKFLDAAKLGGDTATRCYFDAANGCAMANPDNDYCRKKCVQNAYALCRQSAYTAGRYK